MKIEEMADIFLNSANFASHAFLTSAPPSGYALNLKVLIKVSKVSWRSQLSYEILRSSFERKFDKTNFISPKKLLPGHSGLRGLNGLKSSPHTCVTEMPIFWSQKNTQFMVKKFTPNKVGVAVNTEMLSDYPIILLKKAKKVTIQSSANPKLNCLLKIGWNSDMEFLRNMGLFKISCTPISFIPKEICCLLVPQISN